MTKRTMAETLTICKLEELPQGAMRLIEADGRKIGVFRCGDGELAVRPSHRKTQDPPSLLAR